MGIELMWEAEEIAPGRFRSPLGYDKTLHFLKWKAGIHVEWVPIVNLPGIKACHLRSQDEDSEWEGINLYRHGGEVRFFVLPRKTEAEPDPFETSEQAVDNPEAAQ